MRGCNQWYNTEEHRVGAIAKVERHHFAYTILKMKSGHTFLLAIRIFLQKIT